MDKIVESRALHSNVMTVAVQRVDGWCAYVAPVPGKNHDIEKYIVLEKGVKLPATIGRAIFPDMSGGYAT